MKTELELFYLSAQKLVSQDTKNLYNFGMSVVAFDSTEGSRLRLLLGPGKKSH